MKKIDLRVRKTLLAIDQAFLNLLKEKDFQQITIQDIADAALINRATFYAHYADKYELLDKMTEHRLQVIRQFLQPAVHVKDGTLYQNKFKMVVKAIFTNVEREADFFRILMNNESTKNVKQQFETMIHEVFTSQFDKVFGQESTRTKFMA